MDNTENGSLTFLVITRNSEPRLAKVLSQACFFKPDEIVVCIDNRTTDRTETIAREHTNNVFLLDLKGNDYLEPVLNEAISKCNGEWIFRLDDDEFISSEFVNVHKKIAETDVNGILFPTYYCVSEWMFIDIEPWYPDYHLRLFRKDSIVPHKGYVHVPMKVTGKVEYWTSCHIFHMTYLWYSRASREEKIKRYGDRYPTFRDKLNALIVYEKYEHLWHGKIKDCNEKPIVSINSCHQKMPGCEPAK